MIAHCGNCDNTGSLSKTLDGDLDCTHCKIAELRANLNALVKLMPERGEALHFRLYQMGFDAAMALKN